MRTAPVSSGCGVTVGIIMRLYLYPGACSLANHIALIAAGLSHESMPIVGDKRTQDGRDYLEINPRGFVPALELEDGSILTENLVILAYIAEQSGALVPGGELGRWRALEAISYMTTTIHGALGPLFKNASGAERDNARSFLAKGFAFLADQMGAQPFLLGQVMSIADPYLYWTLLATSRFDIALPERLCAFYSRMNLEPSVIEALAEEGISPASDASRERTYGVA